jgi:hypothetical protein
MVIAGLALRLRHKALGNTLPLAIIQGLVLHIRGLGIEGDNVKRLTNVVERKLGLKIRWKAPKTCKR